VSVIVGTVVIILLYAAVRAATRKKVDPMAGRLMSREECKRYAARESRSTNFTGE